MPLTKSRLDLLSLPEIRYVTRRRLKFTRHTVTKDAIMDHILQYASDDLLYDLKIAIANKVDADLPRKISNLSVQGANPYRYMDLPDAARVRECYSEFYKATSNQAVKFVTCAVCAREVGVEEHNVRIVPLTEIPNSHRLIPHCPHPAHELSNGILLESDGFACKTDGQQSVNICGSCYSDLESTSIDNPPALSLANNMWVGPVPWQLQILTLPESLLIAHLYPRVYVVKMYPKAYRGHPDSDVLQRGLRGNVSTYELDVPGVSAMLQGDLMPRPVDILPKVIMLSFIGKGRLPKELLHSTFRVRRQAIAEALSWLKINNPKYYGNIEISAERLASLPEDDVPIELSSTIRQNEDVAVIDHESAGYVNDDCGDQSLGGESISC